MTQQDDRLRKDYCLTYEWCGEPFGHDGQHRRGNRPAQQSDALRKEYTTGLGLTDGEYDRLRNAVLDEFAMKFGMRAHARGPDTSLADIVNELIEEMRHER